jgi:DNA-binding NtrC family response regulator
MMQEYKRLFADFLKLIGSPVFSPDASLFGGIDSPAIIENRKSEICARCENAVGCTAELELYIPMLGRFIYARRYKGNMDLLISLLSNMASVLEETRRASAQSDSFEFYRQLAKKAMDLNPHAISAMDSDGGAVYQNLAAQNDSWNGDAKNAVVFPIFRGSKSLGQIAFSKSNLSPRESAPFADSNYERAFDSILGTDPAIANCIDIALQVSATNSTTLLLGESGTGKEIFARAIHKASPRRSGAFIALNCAAIPENLLESELFGYADGAFTGAKKGGKTGKIVAADGGTLFLDEIGDLPMPLQAKLLRVLQDKKAEPVGSIKPVAVDVRFICATNQHIEALVAEKRFREDLYYRINVIPIHLPPLRTRRHDIAVLLHYNVKKYCVLNDKPFKMIDTLLIDQLMEYEWKGNVRELENVVEYAVTICGGDIMTLEHLPAYLKLSLTGRPNTPARPAAPGGQGLCPEAVPDGDLPEMISRYGFSTEGKKLIAKALGISLATLYRRLKQNGIGGR